jgi:hypothetical protein
MKPGQIRQLQDLSKCYGLSKYDRAWIHSMLNFFADDRLSKPEKADLRTLTHQYRNQIAAMRKNRK